MFRQLETIYMWKALRKCDVVWEAVAHGLLFREIVLESSRNVRFARIDRKIRASAGNGKLHKPVNLRLLYFQRQLNVQGYQCSSDLRYVLFKHNVKPVSDRNCDRNDSKSRSKLFCQSSVIENRKLWFPSVPLNRVTAIARLKNSPSFSQWCNFLTIRFYNITYTHVSKHQPKVSRAECTNLKHASNVSINFLVY